MRVAVLLSMFLLPLIPAQQSVPLSYGVPDDMHFFVHGMTSPTPDPAWVRFERAVRMLADSGIHEDLIDLATIELRPNKRDEVRGAVRQVCDLLGRVDWPAMVDREIVFAYRMSLPIPEYMAIFRVPEDRVGGQMIGMREMLAGFAAMAELPPETVRAVERQTGTLIVFEVRGVPVQVACGAVGDAVVLATSTRLATESMRLLTKGAGARSLATSERFEQGLAQLPAPTEDALYVDVRGLVDFYRQVLRMAMVGLEGQDDEARAGREMLGLAMALLDELDVVEHVVATTQCDGSTTTSTSLIQLVSDFDSTEMAAVVGRQRPWANWHRRVPADATGFCFDTGMNPTAFFDLVLGRIRESVQVNAMLGEHQQTLDTVRDGLSHISGEIAWVSLPVVGRDGCSMGEMVCCLRLEDPDAVARLLPEWIGDASRFLDGRGQRMAVTSRDGVHEIELAAFPWIRPTLAVRGDELVFATSPAALARIDRVQQGQAPSIRERADFTALGLGNRDTVESLAYGQMTAGMGGVPDLISAVGFVMSVLPRDRDTRPLLKLGAILTKLAPALRELDMGYDWAIEAMPGKAVDTWVTRSVYRVH